VEVEVNGEKYKVEVRGGEAVKQGRGGRKLLRIRITAEVDRVWRDYAITFGNYNNVVGRSVARADAPGGGEADA
jgi:hypothetical protein